MSSFYQKQCELIVEDYRAAGGPWPAKKAEIVEWALAHGRWKPSNEDIRRMCGEAIGEAMREAAFTDESGREVRAMLPATTVRNGEQGVFWDFVRTAPFDFLKVGVSQYRNSITALCFKLKSIVRYSNEHRPAEEQLPLSLDFTKCVTEMEQSIRPSSSERSRQPAPPQHAARVSVSRRVPSNPSSRPRVLVAVPPGPSSPSSQEARS